MKEPSLKFLRVSPDERIVGHISIQLVRCSNGKFRAVVLDDSMGFGNVPPSSEDDLIRGLNFVVSADVSSFIHP